MINIDNIDANAITESENVLSDLFNDSSVESGIGTVVRELVIRPMAVIRAYSQQEQASFFNKLDLYKVADGEEADAETVDAVASTYRVKRLPGREATGTILVELEQDTITYIPRDTLFSTGELYLYLDKTFVILPTTDAGSAYEDTAEVSYIKAMRFDNKLYAVFPTHTDEGITETIPSGTPLTFTGTINNIINYSVLSAISGGSSEESNQELAKRVLYGAVRGFLSTPLQIQTAFMEEFGVAASNVAVFGMNDKIVARSLNPITGISQGGFIDIYANTTNSISTAMVAYEAIRSSSDNTFTATLSKQDSSGVYTITNIAASDPNVQLTDIDIVYTKDDSNHKLSDKSCRFSSYQKILIKFKVPESYTSDTLGINVEYLYMRNITALQEYVDRDDNRSVSVDTVVKGAIPCMVDIDISLKASSTSYDIDAIKKAIIDKVNSMPIGTPSFTVEDIINALAPFPVKINFPISLGGTVITADGNINIPSDSAAIILPSHETQTYTYRAVSFFSDATRINITVSI